MSNGKYIGWITSILAASLMGAVLNDMFCHRSTPMQQINWTQTNDWQGKDHHIEFGFGTDGKMYWKYGKPLAPRE